MSLTELLSEFPNYVVLPTLIICSIGFSLIPVAILNYSDRHLTERKATIVAIILCTVIGSLIIIGNFIFV